MSRPEPAAALHDDARTIALVGLVHGTSHFFHLLLPPLFPWFIREFGLSYVELGVVVSVFFVVSGIGQALSGFLVDRVGARPVLYAGLGCFVLSALLASTADGHAGLLAASALAGLGNAPFHPVDFSILNRRVSAARLGHAYSVHGICGNLGWALSPLVSAGLLALTGSLRLTYLAIALLAAAVLGLVLLCRRWLDDRAPQPAPQPAPEAAAAVAPGQAAAAAPRAAAAAPAPSLRALLALPAVWLCFSFLFWSTAALSAVQSFAAPALHQIYGLALPLAALVVSGYMFCGAAGMVVGGFLLARLADQRLESLITLALALAGALLLLAGSGWIGGVAALAVAAAAGLGTGLAGPSRDMLIRRATPAGATGRVYGLVYCGLDLGFALASPVFGRLLDAGRPRWVFAGAALCLVVAVLSALRVGRGLAAPLSQRVTA